MFGVLKALMLRIEVFLIVAVTGSFIPDDGGGGCGSDDDGVGGGGGGMILQDVRNQ
jgi:hypothetical protein